MIAYCPSCYQPSRVPHTDHDMLQCPHCAQEFAAHQESENELTSFRTNIDEPPPVSVMHSGFDQEIAADQDDHEMDIFVEPEDVEDDNEFVLQPVETSLGSRSTTDDSGIDLEVRPTRRKRQKSPIGSLIGVVFGGVAALPIATAILWYGLGTDPLKLAPKVAQYAPWIVPDRLLGASFAPRNTQSSFQQTNPAPTNTESHFTDDQLRAANEAASQPNSESFANNKPEAAAEPPKETTALPFTADEQPAPVENKLILAYTSLEQSFDAMLASGEEPATTSFLDNWQRYIEVIPSDNDSNVDTQLNKLQERLVELKISTLKLLVNASRARVSELGSDRTLGYVDAFEVKEVKAQLDSQRVLLVPSEKNQRPIKSMEVTAPAKLFPAGQENTSQQRYWLFGAVKVDSANKSTLQVLMSRSL